MAKEKLKAEKALRKSNRLSARPGKADFANALKEKAMMKIKEIETQFVSDDPIENLPKELQEIIYEKCKKCFKCFKIAGFGNFCQFCGHDLSSVQLSKKKTVKFDSKMFLHAESSVYEGEEIQR